ncbi:LysR family transcriptional regulator [Paracoccus onubensis]|uniref:LysR family transcriptional regulator n=1 Tax=Paracoccus onubensis TaxID=1675788 RepID=UPI0027314F57|nr:LysR family transcriptional regulator [Paracoccus onubensis]MDP0926317.1 LysR family transcriptional regulator [Paracoccus onubensis]
MDRPQLPLNALRAFEAASRHLNLTRAAIELCVTQAALSHQIRGLEERLGVRLFRRVPRGLVLTEEGIMLAPVLTRSFDEMSDTLDRFAAGHYHETINLGVVNSFATEWLIPRIADFHRLHPSIDLRIHTNNNRVDLAGEGLDLAIRFGDGSWHGVAATRLMSGAMTAVCSPELATRLRRVEDLLSAPLLRSYRASEWERWFSMHGLPTPQLRGPVFDTSLAIAEMAARGHGVGFVPVALFSAWVETGRLVRPFEAQLAAGDYWLTRLHANPDTAGQAAFADWIVATASGSK